ncbi:MAG: hypothetical protein SGARI_000122 [Bacillariaceae sp.]
MKSFPKRVPKDELECLLADTNFSRQEIELLYINFGSLASNIQDKTMDRQQFDCLFEDSGLNPELFRQQLWAFVSSPHCKTRRTSRKVSSSVTKHECTSIRPSNQITATEWIHALNPILRGTPEDVAGLFFDLYDVDGDGVVTADGIILAFSDMAINDNDGFDLDGSIARISKRIPPGQSSFRARCYV